ncbi:MAG: hypothetical protein HXY50_10760 [Ignavibacteriaceae bacterium]|nr:hypothetical protein [Ignavibacteriaceae bacterium]
MVDTSYFEWNSESSTALHIDEKENAIDSLETALQFLVRNDNLKWKWFAFAIHHSLYSFCISALENGNYENVLYKGKEDNWVVSFLNHSEKKISRIVPFFIRKYKTPAFRITWEIISELPTSKSNKKQKISKDNLIGFWTALARVQDQYFWMGRLSCSKAVQISDAELEDIVWLAEAVRNDLTHFVPKSYAIDILSIINSSQIILNKIEFLAFQSHSILFVDYDKSIARIQTAITSLREKLIIEKERITNSQLKSHE